MNRISDDESGPLMGDDTAFLSENWRKGDRDQSAPRPASCFANRVLRSRIYGPIEYRSNDSTLPESPEPLSYWNMCVRR